MLWWHWAVLGLVLAGLEILTPGGFYILFFGLGALLVAFLTLAGAGGPIWLQLLLFTVFSVVSLAVFRNPLLRMMQKKTAGAAGIDKLVGELATPTAAIPAGDIGKAELRGTTWTARNGSAQIVPVGCRCRVTKVDGLVITIEPE
jgi:hypothetical protein